MKDTTFIVILLFLNIYIIRGLFNKISNLEDKIDNLTEEEDTEDVTN